MKPRSLSPSSLFFPWAARQRRLAASRPALSQDEFVTRIQERGGDSEAASLIWTHLHEWGLEESFTPYPTDDLLSVFGIAEDELDTDLIAAILTRFDLPLPTTELLKEFGDVGTPLQVARLVSEMRRRAGRAQEG